MGYLIALLALLGFLWCFWALYVLIMGLYRAHLNKRLVGLNKVLAAPFVLLGLIMDLIANVFVATVFFFELPKEYLVTTRLQRYKTYKNGYKHKWAVYICDHILDVFDPSDDHC